MGTATSRRRNASPPAWSSCACVRNTASTRAAFSRRYVKSGRTRSTPGMSTSGNIKPQSTTRMRPSTSRQKQLRPISPTPPRNVIETGGLLIGGRDYRERVRSPVHSCTCGGAILCHFVEEGVLLAGVGPVLELDDAELGEAGAQPRVARVEQTQLLAVRH